MSLSQDSWSFTASVTMHGACKTAGSIQGGLGAQVKAYYWTVGHIKDLLLCTMQYRTFVPIV